MKVRSELQHGANTVLFPWTQDPEQTELMKRRMAGVRLSTPGVPAWTQKIISCPVGRCGKIGPPSKAEWPAWK